MTTLIKSLVARLPHRAQQGLRRLQFARQIRTEQFRTPEPEWDAVERWVQPGDWVIDVGANVGHYTNRFSALVGATGRVIAFEPVPDTFEILASNAAVFRHLNVTLLNAAASESTAVFGMSIPRFQSGLMNYYEAAITTNGAGVQVMTLSIDALRIERPVRLIKIDAEGHDLSVLRGARDLIQRDKPILIVESGLSEVATMLEQMGYRAETLQGSPNVVFRC